MYELTVRFWVAGNVKTTMAMQSTNLEWLQDNANRVAAMLESEHQDTFQQVTQFVLDSAGGLPENHRFRTTTATIDVCTATLKFPM